MKNLSTIFLTLALACTSSPTGVTDDAKGTQNTPILVSPPNTGGNAGGPTTIPGQPPVGEVSGTVSISRSNASCRATNGTNETVPVYLAVYSRPGIQTRLDLRRVEIHPGGTSSFRVSLPGCTDETCGDWIRAQVDCVAYEEPPETYEFGTKMPGQMLDNAQYSEHCPDCPPPPCKPDTEPRCISQHWDPIKCAWVGPCECPPVGDPECPAQRWDPVKCKWAGECSEECVLPSPQSFYQQPPFGSPASECGHFGLVPGACQTIIRKGGNCFEIQRGPTTASAPVCCVTPQHGLKCFDLSHTTCCECLEE